MLRLFFIACFLWLANPAPAQTHVRGLPKAATVVETRVVPGRRNRMIVLWMLHPGKNPTNYARDEIYSCPDYTRGSHYSGPTHVSLLNSATHKIINTITVSIDQSDEDSFDVPYSIRKGYYYRVPSAVGAGVEAKPNIIWLRDYNGDGKALEFAFFDAPACMGLATTLIGYSEKQDRLIQYPVDLEVVEGAKHSNTVTLWPDYLFNTRPLRPGYWKYEIDYRGRGGSLDKWEVRYNSATEKFEGKLIMIPGD
jgi:hypothetical protein